MDEALAGEEPPRGVPEEILSGGDLYAVQAALTVLAQKVKLQSRAFKQLGEAVAPVAEVAPALRTWWRRRAGRPARRCWTRCWTCATAWYAALGRGWLARAPYAARPRNRGGLAGRYELTAARLDELLAGFNAREIECEGRPFDPRRMQVVATADAAGVAEGTVVEVYRRGYEINGEVYRTAQVKVAKGRQA